MKTLPITTHSIFSCTIFLFIDPRPVCGIQSASSSAEQDDNTSSTLTRRTPFLEEGIQQLNLATSAEALQLPGRKKSAPSIFRDRPAVQLFEQRSDEAQQEVASSAIEKHQARRCDELTPATSRKNSDTAEKLVKSFGSGNGGASPTAGQGETASKGASSAAGGLPVPTWVSSSDEDIPGTTSEELAGASTTSGSVKNPDEKQKPQQPGGQVKQQLLVRPPTAPEDTSLCLSPDVDFCVQPKPPNGWTDYRDDGWKRADFVRESLHWKVFVDEQPSFVFETVPRGGKGKIQQPWDWHLFNQFDTGKYDDGIDDFVKQQTMAYTQIVYKNTIKVKLTPRDENSGVDLKKWFNSCNVKPVFNNEDIVVNTDKVLDENFIELLIPFDKANPKIRQLSIEFDDSESQLVFQADDGAIVGREPKHVLFLFVSPPLEREKDPFSIYEENEILVMQPGPISLDNYKSAKKVLYFPPGVYWMDTNQKGEPGKRGENHMTLTESQAWVHFAHGAYVKSAVHWQYDEENGTYAATGYGVLVGSDYVYQANHAGDRSYDGEKSDGTSLRMWKSWHGSPGQTFILHGVTMTDPPFNSHDMYNQPKIFATDYKQIGGWFYQSDGLTLYPGSVFKDSLVHANDDGLKTYHSDIQYERISVWKGPNDPVFQMGWAPKNLKNVYAKDITILHTRFKSGGQTALPSAIIGASYPYMNDWRFETNNEIRRWKLSGLYCDDICPALVHIYTPMQHYREFVIENVIYRKGGYSSGDLGLDRVTAWRDWDIGNFDGEKNNKITVWNGKRDVKQVVDFQFRISNVKDGNGIQMVGDNGDGFGWWIGYPGQLQPAGYPL
ncbi:unnamed protein product [Amoebophrya sp. A120]|nr:unnamed protein product [Amoebophrya sp. A120]|eukprot:GSA120T00007637001.1